MAYIFVAICLFATFWAWAIHSYIDENPKLPENPTASDYDCLD